LLLYNTCCTLLKVKHKAESILHKVGLTSAEAIRLFYKQICLRKGLLFAIEIPNKKTWIPAFERMTSFKIYLRLLRSYQMSTALNQFKRDLKLSKKLKISTFTSDYEGYRSYP